MSQELSAVFRHGLPQPADNTPCLRNKSADNSTWKMGAGRSTDKQGKAPSEPRTTTDNDRCLRLPFWARSGAAAGHMRPRAHQSASTDKSRLMMSPTSVHRRQGIRSRPFRPAQSWCANGRAPTGCALAPLELAVRRPAPFHQLWPRWGRAAELVRE